MSDWYKDGTANLEYETGVMERYSGYKQTSRIWQERAERMKEIAAHQTRFTKQASEDADKRLELLKQLDKFIMTDSEHCPFCGFIGKGWKEGKVEHKKDCELAEELGDD